MFQDKKVIHLVARGLSGEIGANNKLLWNIPEDLQFFKDSTIGHVVLMGRKTYESLPKKLERRLVYRVSRFESIGIENWLQWAVDQACHDLNTDRIFIAGGGQLYKATEPYVDELWVTQVEKDYPEADTFYHIPEGFERAVDWYGDNCESVGINYSFQKWIRPN